MATTQKVAHREQKTAWSDARPHIMRTIALEIALDKKTKQWIKVQGIIPDGVNSKSFGKGVFNSSAMVPIESTGAFQCRWVDDVGLTMIRHSLGNAKYLWVEGKKLSGEKLKAAALFASRQGVPKATVRLGAVARGIADECEDELVELCGMDRIRGSGRVRYIQHDSAPGEEEQRGQCSDASCETTNTQFLLVPMDQRNILVDLAMDSHKKDELRAVCRRYCG